MSDPKPLKKPTQKQIQNMFINDGIDEDKLRELLSEIYAPSVIQPIIDETKALKASKEEKKEEDKITKRYISTFAVGSSIFESVIMGVLPTFLVYNHKDKKWFTKKDFPLGTELYLPLKMDMTPYPPYSLSHAMLKKLNQGACNKSIQEIYNSILEEFELLIDAYPDIKALGCASVIESYMQHLFEELGYLFLIGARDSGKSRFLEILNQLCYRSMLTSDINEANIFNFIGNKDEGNCTIIEDEAQDLNKKGNEKKLSILRSGYRKGNVCPRILDASSSDRSQVFYKTFSSKNFGGYWMPYNEAFQDRCIPVHMVWGEPTQDKITKEDKNRMRKKRFELLIWRMRNYYNGLPEFDMSEVKGRTREIWESKLRSVMGTDGEQHIRNMIIGNVESKKQQRKQSLEAHITLTLLSLKKLEEVPFSDIYYNLLCILGETTHVNEASYESEYLGRKISKKKVGLDLDSVFGGEKGLKYGIGRIWTFDINILNKLKKKYYIDDKGLKNAKEAIDVAEAIKELDEEE